MKKRLAISLLVGGILSALALYLATRNVPFAELWHYLGTIEYIWILPSTALILVAFFLRALRWQIILLESNQVTFWQAFHPLMIGFMMNCVLPARIGEIARPVLLKKQQNIPISTGLSTVVAERAFDVSMLVILFAVLFTGITSRGDLQQTYFGFTLTSEMLVSVVWNMVRLSVLLMVFIALLTITFTRNIIRNCVNGTSAWIGSLVPRLEPVTLKIGRLVIKIIDNFHIGLTMIKRPARLMATMALTIAIWGISALSYWVFSIGCPGVGLSFVELTAVMVVICFFIALPSVPGFWGLWEAAGVFGLTLFGVAQKDALGFTLVNHALQIFPIICTGLVSAMITSVSVWRISKCDADLGLQ